MDLEKEIEVLKKRLKLLEEFQELRKKVEEFEKEYYREKQIFIPCPYPVYPPTYPEPQPYQPWNPIPISPWYGYTICTYENSSLTLT